MKRSRFTEDQIIGIVKEHGKRQQAIIAFTPFGIENLQELIERDRDRAR